MPGRASSPSALRALLVLGSSSLLSVVAGIASQKVAAVLLDAEGVGRMGLALAVVSFSGLLVGLGIGTSMVAVAGEADAAGDRDRAWAVVRVGRSTVLQAGVAALAVSMALMPFATTTVLGRGSRPMDLVVTVAAGWFWALNATEIGILTTFHRVKVVAGAAAISCFVSPIVNWILFASIGRRGVIPGTVLSTMGVLAVTWVMRCRAVGRIPRRPRPDAPTVARLRHTGAQLMVASFFGSMATLVMGVLINQRYGDRTLGFYRAATVIAEGYSIAIVATIGQDLYPRLVREVATPDAFGRIVAHQIRLIVALFVPVALLVVATLPISVPLFFTKSFTPTADLLRWRVVGDLLRISGSTVMVALIVRHATGTRLLIEAVAATTWIALTLIGSEVFGFVGLGIGAAVHYTIYVITLRPIAAGKIGLVLDRSTLIAVVSASIILAAPAIVRELAGSGAATAVAVAELPLAIAMSWRYLRSSGELARRRRTIEP